MLDRIKFKPIYIIIILALNLVPLAGIQLGKWVWHDIAYFYWGECALIGALIFFAYAKYLIVFFILLSFAAIVVTLTEGHLWGDMRVPATFWCIYSLYWMGYFELRNTRAGTQILLLHPLKQLAIYMSFMFVGIAAAFSLTVTLFGLWPYLDSISTHVYLVFLIMAAVVPTLTIGFLKIIHMVGEKHFLHFLLGTYHRPVEKDRVVLFLDMVGSSKWAEILTPKESMHLISLFIFDASTMIRRHGGDIVNYTGDGLVVLWPITQAEKAISCVYAMRRHFEKIRPLYEKEFGIKTYFRMGLHAGRIVISQIGEEKLFLGVYGDVVNTAARLEEMNKTLDTKVLMSDEFIKRLDPKWKPRLIPKGLQEIRGRKELVDVFTLNIKNDAIQNG